MLRGRRQVVNLGNSRRECPGRASWIPPEPRMFKSDSGSVADTTLSGAGAEVLEATANGG